MDGGARARFTELVTSGTERALRNCEFERARILLALALKADGAAEEARVCEACSGEVAREVPALRGILGLWGRLAPKHEVEASTARLAGRRFAFESHEAQVDESKPHGVAAGNEPFPEWPKPRDPDVNALIEREFFRRGEEGAAGVERTLLHNEALGLSTCDLLAALVQLVLADPFCPTGFTPEMLVAFLGCLRHDAARRQRTKSDAATAEPLNWAHVATLDRLDINLALREALQDDFFYDETDEDAQAAWRDARASRICALLGAVNEKHGQVSLEWLRPLETWQALQALLALPGVTLTAATTLLLFELRRPLLPICWNTMQEAKALGWVPPQASATAAFLHLHARLPSDATVRRRVYNSLSQQNVFRLTRRAVVGDGEKGGVHDGLRQRRAALTVHLDVRSTPPMDYDDDESADSLVVDTGPFSPAVGVPEQQLRDVVAECMQWHKLYPEAGVTPALVVLRPLDYVATRRAMAAFAACALPQQQESKEDGFALRYVLDVHWSMDELLASAMLVGEDSDCECSALSELLIGMTHAGGGKLLQGFGSNLECGLHLAATANRVHGLRALHERQEAASAAPIVDVRGRGALHSAALAGATEVAQELLLLKSDPCTGDRDGVIPLAVAAAAGQRDMCELLLTAAPETVNLGDRRPLELAAASGSLETMRLLLSSGAAIDAQPKSGKTALHAAVRAAQVEAARALVDAGASVTLCDLSDRSAYEVVPDAMVAEFAWLAELSKGLRKDPQVRKPRPQPVLDLSDW